MPSRMNKTRKGGFTIVEVLIVLAIIGLILLVVFLAVPALQRNARNTQRSTDVGNILSAISEYVGNNNGQLPATNGSINGSGSQLTIGAQGSNQIPVQLGYYSVSDISITDNSPGNLSNPGNNNDASQRDKVRIVKGASCSTTTIGDAVPASSRSFVALYYLEPDSKQCRSS